MMRIISVGKLRNKYLEKNFQEYFKRIQKYANVKQIIVKNEKQLIKQLKGYVVVLDEHSSQKKSKQFATLIKDKSNISFVIGAAEGLSSEIKNKADEMLSLSKMTFPHQLIKVFLAEQIYRAFTIIKNENYHK
ncbi:MAG: 23S rRNA (pseudouridine(1915)-N(3))-methyltransferase RlmH [Nanoarchaeota archaeon]|nr:23S rRNA (pseudouridine(1915)-N(3))-methyltransferase RlmH [Nanoarchaeota archaeon]